MRSNASSHVDLLKEGTTEQSDKPTSPIEDADTSGLVAAKVQTATVSPEVTESNLEKKLSVNDGSTKPASEGRLQHSVTLAGLYYLLPGGGRILLGTQLGCSYLLIAQIYGFTI